MNKNTICSAVLATTVFWSGVAAGAAADVPLPTAQTPEAFAFRAPQASVPEPTYAVGSGHLALFRAVNALRQKLGVGLLAQDMALDAAAQAHAVYLNTHSVAQHNQTPGDQGFYEATPLLRARKAGAAASQRVGEVVGAARGPNDFITVYVYTPEMYPTSVRALGCGVAGIWPKFAAIIGPMAVTRLMGDGHVDVAFYALAAVPLVAALAVALFGIETRGKVLEELDA